MRCTVLCILLAVLAFTQTAPPAFEVASVKISQQSGQGETVQTSPGILTMRNVSFTTMVKWAYELQAPQISGPGWLDSQRCDIFARAGGPAKDGEMRGMLRTLLAERFKLAGHSESKVTTVLTLVEAKGGHKMKESEGDGPAATRRDPVRGAVNERTSMAEIAAQLARDLRTPVVDMTGLKGRYDFDFNVMPYLPSKEESRARTAPFDPFDIVQTVLQKELGLKLDSRKAPVEILVIDHMEKSPSEN
jgi:uncharacterized protein (TIGR03435 family)